MTSIPKMHGTGEAYFQKKRNKRIHLLVDPAEAGLGLGGSIIVDLKHHLAEEVKNA